MPENPRYQPELRQRAKELYEGGMSLREVAEEMGGTSHSWIATLLDDAGVKRRSVGRPRKHKRS